MKRLWIERAVGHHFPGDRRLPGAGHSYYDATDEPMATIMAGRPVSFAVEETGMPLWFCQTDRRTGEVVRRNLDLEPMHTIRADGTGDSLAGKYWLEHDGKVFPMPDSDKPPYRVPTMQEIRDLEPNGFSAASTFSGCGGSSLGYRMAGFRVLYANEFVEAARDCYRANAADYTFLDDRDIRTVQASDVLDACNLGPGELDLLDGSPPCASFSTAGKREKAWGKVKKYSDTTQRADDLFFEFQRLLAGIQPRTFVAENVSGLVKGTAKGYFKQILAALKAAGPGYRVSARLLDAQWLGVPQTRSRLIFVGVRSDLVDARGEPLMPAHPDPLPYRYSIRDALPWITRAVHDTSGQFGTGEFTDRPSPAITVGVGSINSRHYQVQGGDDVDPALVIGDPSYRQKPGNSFPRGERYGPDDTPPAVMASPGIIGSAPHYLENAPVEPEADISRYEIGKEWDKLKPGEQSDRFFQLVRPSPDGPSPCVTASGGTSSLAGVTHPNERRKFSIAELRRICGFPDDFVLTGTYAQQWERLGRAVPPVMMSHVAATVRDRILSKAI